MALLPMETTSNRVTASTRLCFPWLPLALLLCFTLELLHSPFSEPLSTLLLRLCGKQVRGSQKHFRSPSHMNAGILFFPLGFPHKLTWLLCLFSLPESSSEWAGAAEVLASWQSLLESHKQGVRRHVKPGEQQKPSSHTLCSWRIWMKL